MVLQGAWPFFQFGPTFYNTHGLSSRILLAPLHSCCCSWWSHHGTDISKLLRSQCKWTVHLQIASHKLSSPCQDSMFLHGPFNPGPSTATRIYFLQWPLWASHSANPQLLPMTPSCLQNQCHMGDSYPPLATSMRYNLGCFWNTAYLRSQETLLSWFHLYDARVS